MDYADVFSLTDEHEHNNVQFLSQCVKLGSEIFLYDIRCVRDDSDWTCRIFMAVHVKYMANLCVEVAGKGAHGHVVCTLLLSCR